MPYTITAQGTGGSLGSGIIICQFAEWGSVTATATDGFNSNFTTSSSTTFNTGSVTTTVNGDLIVGGVMTGSGGTFTHGTGFTLLTQSGNGDWTEYETQTTHGAINPSFNCPSAQTIVGVTGAFSKSAGTFGTAAQQKVGAAGAASIVITPTSTPTVGDFLVAVVSTKSWNTINAGFSVSDSAGSSWQQLGTIFNSSNAQAAAIFYVLKYGVSRTNQLMMMGCGT
jgi:hypothetical protein